MKALWKNQVTGKVARGRISQQALDDYVWDVLVIEQAGINYVVDATEWDYWSNA